MKIMMTITDLHNKAMDIADVADIKRNEGCKDEAVSLYKEAFDLEAQAANLAHQNNIGEPSVSILLRSAASLALSCNLYRESEKLISLALSGEPPFEIAEELRDLMENVNFFRHLELKGIELAENEVQLVIAGKGIGFGYAKAEEVIDRIETFQNLAIRTVERKAGRSFRKNGPVATEHKKFCNYYISSVRAASMAFSIRFGAPGQMTLPGFNNYESIIDDITDNIALINENNIDKLKERIEDPAYLNNFMALTKELAPDGDTVNLFGITSIKNGKPIKTTLTSNRGEIANTIRNVSSNENVDSITDISHSEDMNFRIEGILKAASAKTNSVDIIQESGDSIRLKVPDGLSDIVKKYWDDNVVIEYMKKTPKSKTLHLINIEGKE
ncbi:hypothetical protein D0T56_16110 [Dysgonomonas sp. 520]|nr:hypothetical protein [Dysgonomonas sp. 520]